MQKRIIKIQAVVFGAPNPQTNQTAMVDLIQSFIPEGYMPQTISVQDPISGTINQKLSLIKNQEMQIQFSHERVDFLALMPTASTEDILNSIQKNIGLIYKNNVAFNRIALVLDYILDEFSDEEIEKFRMELLPKSKVNSIEWVSRWVSKQEIDAEEYNICFEAMTANGLMMINNGITHHLNGIKIMHDISTTPSNNTTRFNKDNIKDKLMKINNIIIQQDQ